MSPEYYCAWVVAERLLVMSNAKQLEMLLAGDYRKLAYLDSLRHLTLLISMGVCQESRTIWDDEMPPLLPLINRLPVHMQVELEQAIESERRGQCSHKATAVKPSWLRTLLTKHPVGSGPLSLP